MPEVTEVPPPVLCWSDISQVLTSTVDELAGPLSEKRRGAPLSSGDKLNCLRLTNRSLMLGNVSVVHKVFQQNMLVSQLGVWSEGGAKIF